MQHAEELRDALEALREIVEAAGIDDPDWLARLEEIRDQLDRALSSELRDKLAELQKALQELNAQRTRDALKRLAEAQKELREVLERSRDLFRRAALEGDLANLEQEARELADRQEQWTEEVTAADSARAAAEERNIAAETDLLAQALEQLVEALPAGTATAQAPRRQDRGRTRRSPAAMARGNRAGPRSRAYGSESPHGTATRRRASYAIGGAARSRLG